MLNNKGQVLVLFLIMIPILFGIMVLVSDMGNVIYYKQDMDNINKMVIDYGLDNIQEEDIVMIMNEMITKNKEDIIDKKIEIIDDKIYITLEDRVKDNFKVISDSNLFKIKSSYVGYFLDDKKIIERNK